MPPPGGPAYPRRVDPELVERVVAAASRGSRAPRFPEIDGAKPKLTGPEPKVQGLSRAAQGAIKSAGFRTPESLAGLALGDLGRDSSKLSLSDLDALHRERIARAWDDSKLPKKTKRSLVEHRIDPKHFAGFLKRCGGTIVGPVGPGIDLPVDIDRDDLIPVDPFDPLGPVGPGGGGGPRPPGPEPDPIPWHDWRGLAVEPGELSKAVDLLSGAAVNPARVEEERVRTLLAGPVGANELGEALAVAQSLAAGGDARGAAQLAAHAARSAERAGNLSSVQRYQLAAIAPAVALAAAPGDDVRSIEATASAVLRGAVPGTRAAREAVRATTRARAYTARRRVARAGGPSSPAARAAELAARNDRMMLLTGEGLDEDVRASSAIGLQTAAVLIDVMRATGATVVHGARPGVIENSADRGADGRVLGPNAARHMVGAGGIGSLGDAFLKGQIAGTLLDLKKPKTSALDGLLAATHGDLFRFDYLLGEARRLLDDLTGIEGLLFTLLDTVVDHAGKAADSVDDLLSTLLEELTAQIAKLADQLQGLILELAASLRDELGLMAFVEIIANWPHENWIGLFEGTKTHLDDSDEPGLDVAIDRALEDMLQGEIAGVVDDVEAKIRAKLGELNDRWKALLLEPDAQAEALGEVNTLLAEIDAKLAALGVTSASGQILEALNNALGEIDIVKLAEPVLSSLRGPAAVPGWARALLIGYIAAPFIAVIVFVIIPAILASGLALAAIFIGTSWSVGLLVAAGRTLLQVVLGAIVTFLIVAGVQALISLIARFVLAKILALGVEINNEVQRVLGLLDARFNQLVDEILRMTMLEGLLEAWQAELGLLEGILPRQAVEMLHTLLTGARDTIESRVDLLLCAAERSFFRETLELVGLEKPESAPLIPATTKIAGLSDPRLGSSARYASALSAFEHRRVTAGLDPPIKLTHSFSLRQLLERPANEPPVSVPHLFSDLLAGQPVEFTISQETVDRLLPGAHRVLMKDVQVHVDFDLEGAGFLNAQAAAAKVGTDLAAAFASAKPALAQALVGALMTSGLAPGTTLTAANRVTGLTGGLTKAPHSLPAGDAAVLAAIVVAGLERRGAGSLPAATDTVGLLFASGLTSADLDSLGPLGVDVSARLTALLDAAQPSAKHVSKGQIVAAGIAALVAGDPRFLDELTVTDFATAALTAALRIEDAAGAVVEGSRAIAGAAADPSLDGRIPGGGFPGLAVVAGRIPTGLPIALSHLGPSRVRLRAPGLADHYSDECGRDVAPTELGCALANTKLLTDALNPDAAAEGWQLLEFRDPKVEHVFSHFHVLQDGLRFVLPEKQVKPFEHRGLIGSWRLTVPALANQSVVQLLPAIRDIRIVISTVARHDADLVPKVKQPALELPEPPIPVGSAPAKVTDAFSGALADLGKLFEDLLGDLQGQLDTTLAGLSSSVNNLSGGVVSLIDVASILSAATAQLAALAGVAAPGAGVRMVTLDKAQLSDATALLNGTRTDTTFTITQQMLNDAGAAGTLKGVLGAIVAPAPVSTPLTTVSFPTALGRLTAPDNTTYDIKLQRGLSFVDVPDTTAALGQWKITLPAGMPALSNLGVGLLVQLTPA